MKSLVSLMAASVVFSAGMAIAAEQDPESTLQKMQGRWEVVAGVNQGQKLSDAELDGTYVTVTTNRIVTYDRDEQQRYQAVVQVDDGQKPIHITMTPIVENAPTKKVGSQELPTAPASAGILRFLGEEKWVLCYALPGENRPTKFDSPAGSKILLFTLERQDSAPLSPDDAAK